MNSRFGKAGKTTPFAKSRQSEILSVSHIAPPTRNRRERGGFGFNCDFASSQIENWWGNFTTARSTGYVLDFWPLISRTIPCRGTKRRSQSYATTPHVFRTNLRRIYKSNAIKVVVLNHPPIEGITHRGFTATRQWNPPLYPANTPPLKSECAKMPYGLFYGYLAYRRRIHQERQTGRKTKNVLVGETV